jgi:hemoglobin
VDNDWRLETKQLHRLMKNIPTLYEWAGDMQTFELLFKNFYDKVLKDDLLGEVFKNMSSQHVKHVSHFVAEVFGGPGLYSGEDGGSHAIMAGHHIGKMLTEEKRQRWIHLLILTADEMGLKSDPEFRSAFVGYLEWGTRIAVINSQLSVNPMGQSEPMPKWGWGETGGPYTPGDK